MLVAIVVGRQGIDTLLVISQVVLSIVLPFVMFPLIWLTSSSVVMRVPRPRKLVQTETSSSASELEKADGDEKMGEPASGSTTSSSKKEPSDNDEYTEAIVIESGDDDQESVENEEPESRTKEKRKEKKRKEKG